MPRLRATRLTAIATAVRRLGPANSATDWYFAALGLAGTPWADVSRTGLGTRVDAAGLVRFGPHNLLTFSQQFDNAVWTKVTDTVTANTATAPDGTLTADTYTHTSGRIQISASTANRTVRLYVKPVSGSSTFIIDTAGTAGADAVSFNLTTVTVTSLGANNTAATITSVGDGWLLLTVTRGATAGTVLYFGLGAPASVSYIWGAQMVEYGAPPDYVPTTTAARYLPRITHDPVTLSALGLLVEGQGTNLLGATEDLTNAYWAKQQATAPTASTIQEDSSTAQHRVIRALTAANGGYTFTGWVGAGTRGFARVSISDNSTGSAGIDIDLTTGSTANVSTGSWSGLVANVVARTEFGVAGWAFRVSAVKGAGSEVVAQINVAAAFGVMSYAGNGTGNIRATKLQLESGLIATSYIPNPGTGSAVRVADWTGPGVVLTGAALAAAFPAGFGQNTIVFSFAKTGTRFETLLALSAGTDYGPGNGLLIRDSGGSSVSVGGNSGSVSQGGLTLDGVTFNRVAVSWSGTNLQLSVNGQAPVSLGTLDFTGSGTTSLILGALTTGGLQPIASAIFRHIRVLPGQYITGAALQALTA